MSNFSKRSRLNSSRLPRQQMSRTQSSPCLWRLSGRYNGSGGINRGWTARRPQMFDLQAEIEKYELEGDAG